VLLLMARGARVGWRLAGRSVGRMDVSVATGAGRRDWLALGVGAVTAQAFFGLVHLHGWRRALGGQVAVRAILGAVRVRGERLPARQRFERRDRGVLREAVAEGTVGLARATELRVSFRGSVRQLGLLFVARGAALGPHRSDVVLANAVAFVARHVLVDHVHLVPASLARLCPDGGHVDTQTGVGRARGVSLRARREHRRQQG
jgi:hypothetical protein